MKILATCIAIVLATSLISLAQENANLSKKEKKELKKKMLQEQKEALLNMLESKQWIIEAHTVFDRYNQSYQLNPTINFVGIKGKEATIQLGFDGLIGWNGVGGVTVDGEVTSYEINQGKGNSGTTVNLRFKGRASSSANINITINASGQATARVNGDFGGRITFSGAIKSLDESSVYKGQSLF